MSSHIRSRLLMFVFAFVLCAVPPAFASSTHRPRRHVQWATAGHQRVRHHRSTPDVRTVVFRNSSGGQRPPNITAETATRVTATSAQANGLVSPEGRTTTYIFQYGTSTSYGSSTASARTGQGNSNVAVSATLVNLKPSTTYRYRIVATNAAGTTYGNGTIVTTASAAKAPTVTSATPTGVTGTGATLNGTVNPNGSSTVYYYQYGPTSSYGSSTATVSAGQGTSVSTAAMTVSGLVSSSTYHSRIVASNAAGSSYGSDQTFATTAPPPQSSYDEVVLADHPVAYLAMSGTSTEPDLTGYGHTGTYKGGAPVAATLPDGERAADFNATGSHSGQYLTVPSSTVFSIPTTHQLTWEAWIRPDVLQFAHPANSDGYVDWMGKCQDYSPSCEWEARMYSAVTSQSRPDRLSAYVFNPSAGLGSAADWQPASGVIGADRWVHVVGEYQTLSTPSGCSTNYPGTINIWIDGVQQNFASHVPTGCMSQYSITPRAGSSPLDIGTMALDSWFQGAVGKVAIYDALLSSAQITAHYRAMTGVPVSGSCGVTCTIP